MTEESVNVIAESGNRTQWARGLIYRKDGAKETLKIRALQAIGGIIFIFAITGILMKDTRIQLKRALTSIKIDTTMVSAQIHELPQFYEQEEPKKIIVVAKPRKVKKPSKPLLLPGLSKVTRPSLVNVPVGTIGEAVLLSSASDGLVRAKLSKSVIAYGERFIDRGVTLIGKASSGRDRLQVRFTKIILNNGQIQKIKAIACEPGDESIGLKGAFVAHNVARIAGAIGLNFIGGFSEGFQESEVQQGVAVKKANARNALLKGTEKASLEEAQAMMRDLKSNPPKVYVPKGKKICLMFEDLHGG